MKENDIVKLLNWYSINKRNLPWRHTDDSYKIWISEVMLQQTRVEAVKEYYHRFLVQLPDIESLAAVSEDNLLKLWEGLGYYSRARNLKKCAEKVLSLGYKKLPNTEEEIKNLPGIGPYTAGAILSIAYHQCVPAIDGNVMRILSRVFEDSRDMLKKSVQEEYRSLLKSFMKEKYARDFTESFIELGALICLPNGTPKCLECPFRSICKSYKHHTMLNYPVKRNKKERKVEEKTVFVFQYKNTFFIQKRNNTGLLASLYEFPNEAFKMSLEEVNNYLLQHNYFFSSVFYLGEFRHSFSHVEWHMNAYVILLNQKFNGLFLEKEDIETKYSLPTAFFKVYQKIK